MRNRFTRIIAGFTAAVVLSVSSFCIYAEDTEENDTDSGTSYTMRTENEVLRTMKKACENESFVLYYSEEEDLIALECKKNGYVWWSSPVNAEADTIAKGNVKKELESSLIVVYGEPEKRTGSTLRSARNGKMKYKVTGNTLEITYRFPSAGFVIPVQYTLDEDSLRVHADTSEFKENKREEGENMVLLELSVLPNMLTAGSMENGYYIIPDGSGAVINFNNGKTDSRSYSSKVYGNDITAVPLYKPENTEKVYLPVYASVKETGNGMLAVIHEGDENVLIQSSVSGLSKSSYNTCSSRFILRNTDTYYMNSEPLTVFEDGEIGVPSLEIRFYPLCEKELDYTDVAEVYRQYLIDEKNLTQTENTLPLSISLYGGVQKKEPFLGIPITRKKAVTSFEQAKSIVSGLKENGADSMVVTLENWTDDGIEGKADYKAKPSSVLGTSGEFRDMVKYFDDNGIEFYPVVNNTTFNSGNGYYAFSDTAMRASGQYSKQISYTLAYGTKDGMKKAVSLLSPSVYSGLFSKISSGYSKAGLSGICPGDLSSVLCGDYGKKHIERCDTAEFIEEGMAGFKENIGSVLTSEANSYVFEFTDYISEVPLCSGGYDIFDEDIPFYQLVLHGLIPYSSTAVNGAENPEELILKAAAAGSGIHFDMVGEEISILKDTEYDIYFYADSDAWTKKAAAGYRFIRDVLSGTEDEYITEYSQKGEIIETEYSNGTVVTVNLKEETAQVSEKTYVLSDYLNSDGGAGNDEE